MMLLRRMGTYLVMDGERKVHKIKWALCAKIDYGGNQMVEITIYIYIANGKVFIIYY